MILNLSAEGSLGRGDSDFLKNMSAVSAKAIKNMGCQYPVLGCIASGRLPPEAGQGLMEDEGPGQAACDLHLAQGLSVDHVDPGRTLEPLLFQIIFLFSCQ